MRNRAGHRKVETLERRMLLDAVPLGPAFLVNTITAFEQSEPAIAMNADGRFVVVWSGPDGVSANDIFAQRFAADGTPLGDEFLVNTTTTGFDGKPAVAMDADGDFVVVWQSAVLGGGSTHDGWGFGIYAQGYNSSGTRQGGEFRVNSYTTEDQVNPAIAMDASGDFVIVWESELQEGSGYASGYGIYAQRYDSSGDAQDDEFRVNTFTTNSQRNASVAMDVDGDFIVTWQSWAQAGTRDHIFAQRYNAAGAPQGEEFRVSPFDTTGIAADQEDPTVAMDETGNFAITWESDSGPAPEDIYVRRYSAAGVAQGDPILVNTALDGRQFTPSIAMNSDGAFVIAWYSHPNGFPAPFTVRGKYFSAAGIAQGGEFIVSGAAPASVIHTPAIRMDADGDFVVAWTGYGNGNDVFARRYTTGTSAPAVVGEEFLYETAPHKLVFAFNQDVSLTLGLNDIVVDNLTTGMNVNHLLSSVTYDQGTDTATFTFFSPIPDGNYRATLLASGIFGPEQSLPADHVFTFRFLRGDANNDGRVNLQDFNILAANFGATGATFSRGDFNYDTIVNLQDFNILAARFGSSLMPASPEARAGANESGHTFSDRWIGLGEDREVSALLA